MEISWVTWETNAIRCNSIGMRPLAFETVEIFDCFKIFTTQEIWYYNFNYWTSGRRALATNSFQWYFYNTSDTFANITSMWAITPNSSSGDCVHLSVLKNMNTTGLTQKNCTNKFVFSCKGTTTVAPSNNTANNKTWSDAISFCCTIGMKLLSMDTNFKHSALSVALGNGKTLVSKYWTSGTDYGCDGAFGWCTVNKLFREPVWAPGEPQPGKHCVAVDFSGGNATLIAADCSTNLRFICEARDAIKSTSRAKGIQDECAAIFNITETELDSIFNSTSFDVKIKCFLKCLGESGGVVFNGRLVDEQLLKLVEHLSTDNDKLMSGFQTVDECSKIQGMDDCDTVALAFQCGQEKDPILVKNTVKIVELNNSAEQTPVQPSIGQCITDYQCVMTDYHRQIFLTNGSTDGLIVDICRKRYLLGKKETTYREGASWCCKYGLNLVSFETVEELKCLVSSPLGGRARPIKIWTSACRIGASIYGFRWCTSNANYNVSMWTWLHPMSLYYTHTVW
ncbi:Hypothetical predicted protein [Cloeon dipterum]|uniref:C-type lectin domain-containing protein n=1 Tax=Cloeon dipterum TaxID=197152 RepID=A0A8S1CL89_9INSE|nr:Hypothetical predicted protein [Cloeon dipterum]